MTRIRFPLQVRPDRLDEYRARHRAALLGRSDGLLVGYLETDDFEPAQAGMADREVKPFFELAGGGGPDEAMRPLEEIFHLA